eukprot:1139223-Rhodomonas_salina.1
MRRICASHTVRGDDARPHSKTSMQELLSELHKRIIGRSKRGRGYRRGAERWKRRRLRRGVGEREREKMARRDVEETEGEGGAQTGGP